MVKITEQMLPELPESPIFSTDWIGVGSGPVSTSLYTEQQMKDYARAALEAALSQGDAVDWQSMTTCPRDGSVVWLRWGEDHVSPGWWSAPVSPIQNDDGTWPSETGGFPWAFFDRANRETIVNHAVDTEYGPTHWAPYPNPQPAPQSEPVVINLAVKKRIVSDRPEGMSCDYVYGWNDCVNTLAATGKQSGIDPSWSLHDRVEFALRDSGFDLDEASRIALLADGKQSGSERERFEAWLSERPYMSFAGYAWEAWQAATASRETVGVEPVAVIGSDFTICWVGSGPIAPLVERNGIKKGSFLYAAPPAQGVDLGQFRPAVEAALRHSSPYGLERENLNRLLALIDQRDGEVG